MAIVRRAVPDSFSRPEPHGTTSRGTVDNVITITRKMGERALSLLSGLLAAVLILYSGYVLYDSFYIQNSAHSSWDLLEYRPEIIDDGAVPMSGRETLAAINKDYRAWLTLFDTNIDYPVMQGENDLYYANHDIYGQSSLTGAIYVASANTGTFEEAYNLVYGHHMDNGAMFGGLDSFTDETYFESHREGIIVTPSGTYDLLTFAVMNTDAYDSNIYNVSGKTAESLLNYLQTSDGTIIFREGVANTNSKIVAFSTCAAADTNGRLVVFAVMIPRDMTEITTVNEAGTLTLSIGSYDGTYDGLWHGINVQSSVADALIEYSTDGGVTWTTEMPRIRDAGTITVTVRASYPGLDTAVGNAVLRVRPAEVVLTVDDVRMAVGDEEPELTATVTGLLAGESIDYTIVRTNDSEEIGVYRDSLVMTGNAVQGNYTVTVVPGTLTITADTEVIEEDEVPLAPVFQWFDPKGSSYGRNAWALVNLICLVITAYIFLPLLDLRGKFRRGRILRKINNSKAALRTTPDIELNYEERLEKRRLFQLAIETRQEKTNAPVAEKDITAEDFYGAVETLYYRVRRFVRRFRFGFVLEILIVAAAIAAFILTEDIRMPMVLIDRWTPLMLIILIICWIVDVRLMRYRGKAQAEKEAEEERRRQLAAEV